MIGEFAARQGGFDTIRKALILQVGLLRRQRTGPGLRILRLTAPLAVCPCQRSVVPGLRSSTTGPANSPNGAHAGKWSRGTKQSLRVATGLCEAHQLRRCSVLFRNARSRPLRVIHVVSETVRFWIMRWIMLGIEVGHQLGKLCAYLQSSAISPRLPSGRQTLGRVSEQIWERPSPRPTHTRRGRLLRQACA